MLVMTSSCSIAATAAAAGAATRNHPFRIRHRQSAQMGLSVSVSESSEVRGVVGGEEAERGAHEQPGPALTWIYCQDFSSFRFSFSLSRWSSTGSRLAFYDPPAILRPVFGADRVP